MTNQVEATIKDMILNKTYEGVDIKIQVGIHKGGVIHVSDVFTERVLQVIVEQYLNELLKEAAYRL